MARAKASERRARDEALAALLKAAQEVDRLARLAGRAPEPERERMQRRLFALIEAGLDEMDRLSS